MDLYFDRTLAEKYRSRSQAARVLTETWADANMYCPRCGNPQLTHFKNNREVADFFCDECKNEYELKSKNGEIGRKIMDGAYETFIQRITSANNPDFLVMSYDFNNLRVDNLLVVPKYFFTPSIVEKRNPLGPRARRAGWVGSNILFNEVPEQGRIYVVRNGIPLKVDDVLEKVKKSSQLETSNLEARGWLLDTLNCVNRFSKEIFSLNEIYQFENELSARHPENNNVKAKIRQQLQLLRDRGFLEFLERGVYRKKASS